jgi:hypothetical protein
MGHLHMYSLSVDSQSASVHGATKGVLLKKPGESGDWLKSPAAIAVEPLPAMRPSSAIVVGPALSLYLFQVAILFPDDPDTALGMKITVALLVASILTVILWQRATLAVLWTRIRKAPIMCLEIAILCVGFHRYIPTWLGVGLVVMAQYRNVARRAYLALGIWVGFFGLGCSLAYLIFSNLGME